MKVKFKMPFFEIETSDVSNPVVSFIVSMLVFILFDILAYSGLHKTHFISHDLKVIVFLCLISTQGILLVYSILIKTKAQENNSSGVSIPNSNNSKVVDISNSNDCSVIIKDDENNIGEHAVFLDIILFMKRLLVT